MVCRACAAAQEPFSCLPATMLASSIQTPVASATWEGCLTSNTYLAWYGERCGSTFSQVRWTGVYAFDKTTGARLASCVKQRPATGTLSADLKFWLGECGVTPAALATVPNRICQDPYVRKFGPELGVNCQRCCSRVGCAMHICADVSCITCHNMCVSTRDTLQHARQTRYNPTVIFQK